MPGITREEKRKRKEEPVVRLKEEAPRKRPCLPKRTWEESFQALVAYKEKHGDCNVPQRYKDDRRLGTWVGNQRRGRFQLSQAERDRFDELGFDWETQHEKNERWWNEKFERLKAYRRDYGDCCVPQGFKRDPELAAWVAKQRMDKKRGKIEPHRRNKLNSIDFTWRLQEGYTRDSPKEDEKWFKKYKKLVQFHREEGHCIVPNFYEKDKILGDWVVKQRTLFKNGFIRKDRKDLLDDLGFVWKVDKADPNGSLTQEKWDKMFERLEWFKNTYGHVEVHRTFTKWGLGSWMSVQRADARKGRLDPRRAERLRAIGVTWGKDFDERWNEKFEMLKQFKKDHGHCLVPTSGENIDHTLANWVSNQRVFCLQGTLLPERKAKLDALGFVWCFPDHPLRRRLANTSSSGEETETDHSSVLPSDIEFSDEESLPTGPKYAIGTKVLKYFNGHGLFSGKVISFDGELYKCLYEDGDEEEYTESELEEIVVASRAGAQDTDQASSGDETLTEASEEVPSRNDAGDTSPSQDPCKPAARQGPDRDAILASTDRIFSQVEDQRSFTVNDVFRSLKDEYGIKKLDKPTKGLVRERLKVLMSSSNDEKQLAQQGKVEQEHTSARHAGAKEGRVGGDKPSKALVRKQPKVLVSSSKNYEQPATRQDIEGSMEPKRKQCAEATEDRPDDMTNDQCTGRTDDDRESDDKLHPVGSTVKKFFRGHGWFQGTITKNRRRYKVRYEDGDVEKYEHGDPELDAMVEAGRDSEDESNDCATVVDNPDLVRLKVGSRVAVYWESEHDYFDATVKRIRKKGKYVFLRYDDGDEECIDLGRHRWFSYG